MWYGVYNTYKSIIYDNISIKAKWGKMEMYSCKVCTLFMKCYNIILK